jgi:hypothetical protein
VGSSYYKKDGKKYPRVTSIVGQLDKSGPLTQWAANCACDYILEHLRDFKDFEYIVERARKEFRKVSAKAMDVGTQTHKAIERYLKTGEEPKDVPDEVLSAFVAFLEWLDTWDSWETIETEKTVYWDEDENLRWAGTLDWDVLLNSDRYIVDFKTYNEESKTKPPYEEVRYQTAGYRSHHGSIVGNGALYLGKQTGKPVWCDLSKTYNQDLAVFHALVETWYARKEWGK